MAATNSNPNNPDFVPKSYTAMQPNWAMARALLESMWSEEIRKEYLSRKEGEPEKAFTKRVALAVLDNYYEPALRGYVNQLTNYSVEDPLEILEPIDDNVDLRGSSLTAFLMDALIDAMAVDSILFCVDYSEKLQRPYLLFYPIDKLTAPLVIWENAKPYIARVGVRFNYSIPDGEYGSKEGCGVRIYRHRPARTETWYDVDGTWVKQDSRNIKGANGKSLQELPLVWFSVQGADTLEPKASVWDPLARLNVLHFNKASEIDTAETITNLPTPVRIGVDSETSPALYLGYNACVDLPLGCDIKYLEPSGASIGSSNNRQMLREKAMERLSKLFTTSDTGVRTATEVRAISEANKRGIESIAKRIESAFSEVMKVLATFSNPSFNVETDDAGEIELDNASIKAPPNADEIRVLTELFSTGLITIKEARSRLADYGVITEQDNEAIEEAEELPNDLPASISLEATKKATEQNAAMGEAQLAAMSTALESGEA